MSIKGVLVSFMKEAAYKPMTLKEIAKIFAIRKGEMKDFQATLNQMEDEGLIIKNQSGLYGVPEKMGVMTGRFQGHAKGFGFVIPDDGSNDYFIPLNSVHGAMNGDRVIVKLVREQKEGKKREGEIERVIERANKTIIGTYEDGENFGFVVAEDKRIYNDIFVAKSKSKKAKDKEIVIVEITEWPKRGRNPEGRIIEILGKKGDKGLDILTIIKKFGLPEEFPSKVMSYAEGIPETIPEEEYGRRRDLRDMTMVTIDGEDAKDLDDAVSIEKLENGNYKLGVHIADVSHYVKEKNVLDKEALKRGTSVYLIDRVIPMLPKKLSNGMCSLNPRVDRLTLTCMMEIDPSGKVLNNEIFESIIKTNERMTYTDVTKILRDKDEELIKKYEYLHETFKTMEELCLILNKKRMKRGAIDFDFEESKIILDELGKPVDIKPYDREIANRVIEEFMLVCNETVAEYMFWTNIPFVYRIHENPSEEKMSVFSEFVYNLGIPMKPAQTLHPRTFQEILEKVKGEKEEVVVSTLMLRSMMKARYAPECEGHFGLAARYYCHFTSPIRRYPDLIIHRIIKSYINGHVTEKKIGRLKNDVADAAIQSSDREKVAMEAEREVDDLKKAEYMSERIGEIHEGIISSVTNFGMFVELPNTVEGLVHISDLDDDYYTFDEKHLCLMGEHRNNRYRLGDAVTIIVDKVDMDAYDVYFKLVKDEEDETEEAFDHESEILDEINRTYRNGEHKYDEENTMEIMREPEP